MKITDSKIIKMAFVAMLIIGVASALQVEAPTQVKTTQKGEMAQYAVELTNENSNTVQVSLSVESEVSTTLSDELISISPGQTKTIRVFAVPETVGEGTYMINLQASQETLSLALNIEEGAPALSLTNSYGKMTVKQGTSQEIKLVARNTGNREIKNIVLKSDLSEKFNAEYPDSFDLEPDETREVSVVAKIPSDYPKGEYTYTVEAASGDIQATREVNLNIVGKLPVKDRLTLEAKEPWETIQGEEGPQGYKVTFEITNKGLTDLENVEWEMENVPEDWNLTGTENFDIKGGEIIQKTVFFDSQGEFSEETVEVKLLKDGEPITSKELEFSGEKVGLAGTGLVLGGGSLFIGTLTAIVVALVFAFLYIRERNLSKNTLKKHSDKKYLEKLVDKTVEEEPEEDTEEE